MERPAAVSADQPFALPALLLLPLPHQGSYPSGHLAVPSGLMHVSRFLPLPSLTTSWVLLEIEVLTDPEPITFHSQPPIMLRVMETTLKAWQSSQGLLKTGWSQTWAPWHSPPARRSGFPWLQSLARCHGVGGGHPFARLFGPLGSPLR